MTATITYRPLGKVRDIVQSSGLDISYAYDDLVFSEHSVFIIRFNDANTEKLHLYFNTECNVDEAIVIEKRLKITAKIGGFEMVNSGKFTMVQVPDKEELSIEFIEL